MHQAALFCILIAIGLMFIFPNSQTCHHLDQCCLLADFPLSLRVSSTRQIIVVDQSIRLTGFPIPCFQHRIVQIIQIFGIVVDRIQFEKSTAHNRMEPSIVRRQNPEIFIQHSGVIVYKPLIVARQSNLLCFVQICLLSGKFIEHTSQLQRLPCIVRILVFFYPPYSILYWNDVVRRKELDAVTEELVYTTRRLLSYDNVRVFCFLGVEEIVCNLNNYADYIHYHEDTCRYITDCFVSGQQEVTQENCEEVFEALKELALTYDYESIWEDWQDPRPRFYQGQGG